MKKVTKLPPMCISGEVRLYKTIVHDGVEGALAYITRARPDLDLTCYAIRPSMGGLELAVEVQGLPRSTKRA